MTRLDDLPFDVSDELRELIGDRDLDELRPEDLAPPEEPLTPKAATVLLAALAARIADGRAAACERAALIARLARENWTQDAIAKAAGISQAAVSKALRSTPGSRSLEECRTAPYLAGRLTGVALHLSSRRSGMGCERYADKIARGGVPPAAPVIGRLEALLSRDLAKPGIPAPYREAYAEVTERLAEFSEFPPLPWPVQGQWEMMLGQHHQSKALTDALKERGR
jgi:transcriptional regulator with XRE-family HTH domain